MLGWFFARYHRYVVSKVTIAVVYLSTLLFVDASTFPFSYLRLVDGVVKMGIQTELMVHWGTITIRRNFRMV